MEHVGDDIHAKDSAWSFGGNVCEKFDDHVAKSIPLYHKGHQLIVELSDFFLSQESVCYDLGCSTGKLAQMLATRSQGKNVRINAVDVEEGMANKARERCREFKNVHIMHTDIVELKLETADLVVAYYTLQFIKPKDRQNVLDRIYRALNPGRAFLLFEKVSAPDARFQDMMTDLYMNFKLDNGYNEQQIFSKRRSLKGVLEPCSSEQNIEALRQAGFTEIVTIMKYICFEGFLAIK